MHVSGHVDELPILEDSEFGVAERCMKLVRMVEMYQYTEHKTTSTRKDGRGGEIRETVRVCVCVCMSVCSQVGCHSHSSSRRTGGAIMIPQNYHYTSEWSSRPIPSSRFDDPSFSNPTVRCACLLRRRTRPWMLTNAASRASTGPCNPPRKRLAQYEWERGNWTSTC